ncbi:MAG TPA: acyltransferase, partial [Micromonosporaceae bacterium]|nr:acyltransferase [Micromonosporaceae bacterium]
AVVVHHIRLPESAPEPLRQIAGAGYIGVPLFFMLSGVVLAWNYPDIGPSAGWRKVLRFYVARIARVMPLYWIILAFLMLRTAAQGRPQSEWWLHALTLQTWSGDLRIGQQSYNSPAWSVCVEIFLYALFPFLVPLVAMVARRYGTTGLVALAAAAFAVQLALCTFFAVKGWVDINPKDPRSAHRWMYRNPLPRIPDFVVGVSIAFLLMRGRFVRRRFADIAQVGCVVAVLLLTAFKPDSSLVRVMFYGAMWTVPFAVLLFTLAAAPGARLSRLLSTKTMVRLGAASYALYMTHRWLLDGFGLALARKNGWAAYAMVFAILALCLLVAEGAHRYIEVPARKAILGLLRPRRKAHQPPAPPTLIPPAPRTSPEELVGPASGPSGTR